MPLGKNSFVWKADPSFPDDTLTRFARTANKNVLVRLTEFVVLPKKPYSTSINRAKKAHFRQNGEPGEALVESNLHVPHGPLHRQR
jgi:hypothetical protein